METTLEPGQAIIVRYHAPSRPREVEISVRAPAGPVDVYVLPQGAEDEYLSGGRFRLYKERHGVKNAFIRFTPGANQRWSLLIENPSSAYAVPIEYDVIW